MFIFVSYSHRDELLAIDLCQQLEHRGITTWRDKDRQESGDPLPTRVFDALDRATTFIYLASAASRQSTWVQMELNAALVRYAGDPAFRIIPVVLDDAPISSVVNSFYSLDSRVLTIAEIADGISQTTNSTILREFPNPSRLEALIDALEADQFTDDPSSGSYGGWSKSYAKTYLPIAFPGKKPESVSSTDSLSVTHWIIRGLLSLQRLISQSPEDVLLSTRVARLIATARNYMHRHFDGQGAGLSILTTQGEQLKRDPRHSAAFVKALVAFGDESTEILRTAAEYSLTRFKIEGDGRLASSAEVYYLAWLTETHPSIRSTAVTDELLISIRRIAESQFANAKYEAIGATAPITLLREIGQPHMSSYYSWWVLDACGELLRESSDNAETLVDQVAEGLAALSVDTGEGGSAFPLTIGGPPDLGATAQIAEVLLRCAPRESLVIANRVARFLDTRLTPDAIKAYPYPFMLWSIPVFFERLKMNLQTRNALDRSD